MSPFFSRNSQKLIIACVIGGISRLRPPKTVASFGRINQEIPIPTISTRANTNIGYMRADRIFPRSSWDFFSSLTRMVIFSLSRHDSWPILMSVSMWGENNSVFPITSDSGIPALISKAIHWTIFFSVLLCTSSETKSIASATDIHEFRRLEKFSKKSFFSLPSPTRERRYQMPCFFVSIMHVF